MKIELTRKRLCHRLTIQGWLLVLFALTMLVAVYLSVAQRFLAVSEPIDTKIMILEGWISDAEVSQAMQTLKNKNYNFLLITGAPVTKGGALAPYHDYAELTLENLKKQGYTANNIIAIPVKLVRKDRTYASAVEVKTWLEQHNRSPAALNIFTSAAHARRTRLLYRKAFGEKTEIGIVALENPDYNPDHWYTSSNGVRVVLGETIAYLYALLFFHPGM